MSEISPYSVTELTDDQIEIETVWRDLLGRSHADPLFLSWAWQSVWWKTYSGHLTDARRRGVMLTGPGQQVACIANLYLCQTKRLSLLNFRSLQFVGTAWRNSEVMLSEYVEPVASANEELNAVEQVLAHIGHMEWDEFVAELTPEDGTFAGAVRNWARENRWYLRELDQSSAYMVRLERGFGSYVKRLSPNARRRLFNNRSKLARHGSVRSRILRGADLSAGLSLLNELHARRWGQPAFDGRRLMFLNHLSELLPVDSMPFVSVIEVNGEPVSAVYDIRVGSRQYNLQMGFDPTFDPTISLGLLHLGYAIEDAAACGVRCYDFLGGGGLRTNYKGRISTHRRPLVTLQIIRRRVASAIYAARDRLRKKEAWSRR